MLKKIKKQQGASMVEYAMMVALITIIAIGSIKVLGSNTSAVFQNAGSHLSNATG